MSQKNSRMQKMYRREMKKLKDKHPTHNKDSKWIPGKNKYGLLQYMMHLLPRDLKITPVKGK